MIRGAMPAGLASQDIFGTFNNLTGQADNALTGDGTAAIVAVLAALGTFRYGPGATVPRLLLAIVLGGLAALVVKSPDLLADDLARTVDGAGGRIPVVQLEDVRPMPALELPALELPAPGAGYRGTVWL